MQTLKTIAMATTAAAILASCSGGKKEVLVMGSGKLTLGENSVTIEPGSRHNEEKLLVSADKITVKGFEGGDKEITVAEPGLYVLNLKKDTLVGAYQRVGEGSGETRITQDILRQRVDSLQQLTTGTNVSAEKRNFFLPPGAIAKLTTNNASQVIGPYLKMPTTFAPGQDYEIYKFYTNKEMAEIIAKIKPMMSDVDSSAVK
jgi:hypothetical protein